MKRLTPLLFAALLLAADSINPPTGASLSKDPVRLLVSVYGDARGVEHLGHVDTSGDSRAVAVSGDYVYLADGEAGLRVIDVLDPAAPAQVGLYQTPSHALDVSVVGDYAYLSWVWVSTGPWPRPGGMYILDISDPAAPSMVGAYSTEEEPSGLEVVGDYAYITIKYEPLRVVNVSDPAHPAEVGSYDFLRNAQDVAAADSMLMFSTPAPCRCWTSPIPPLRSSWRQVRVASWNKV